MQASRIKERKGNKMKSFFASTDKENAQQAGYLFLIVNILGFVTTALVGKEK